MASVDLRNAVYRETLRDNSELALVELGSRSKSSLYPSLISEGGLRYCVLKGKDSVATGESASRHHVAGANRSVRSCNYLDCAAARQVLSLVFRPNP